MLVDFADELFTFLPAGSMESIRADFDLSYAQAGVVLAMLSAGGFLGMFFKSAADFVSRRVLASGGALLYGLCLLGFAGARSFAVLVVAAFLWGAASDAFLYASQLALAELAGDELDATLARTNLLGAVGDLLGPVVLSVAVVTGLGWRPVFAAAGVLMLGYAVVLGRQPLPPPRPDGSTPWSVVRAVTTDRRVWRVAAALGLLTALDEPFLGFLISSFETRGLSAGAATALAGSIVVGSIAGFAALAVRGDALRNRAAVLGSAGLVGSSMVLVAAPWPVVLAIAGFVFGAGIALVWVVLQATVLRLRPGQAGTTEAVVAALASFEIAIPPLIGVAADAVGLPGAMWIYVAVTVAMLVIVTGPALRRLRGWPKSSRSRSRR
jgi:FSR family fosmidomycin resistance protein-like MFS transporter